MGVFNKFRVDMYTLASFLMFLAFLIGVVVGSIYANGKCERVCNDFILENYIIPGLESQGFVVEDGMVYEHHEMPLLGNMTLSVLET